MEKVNFPNKKAQEIILGLDMAGVAGFEPTNGGIKTRCLTAWLYPKRQ
ncbi:hypothetical protein GLIP_0267 [Aliiglaciecola lipolytica E3]|uniref:Uncharacterized protein n=1 Tax=Aliiglaciecola lipolytica E3 TaxID=1127673 RepID=K6Y8F3_9ALTE|nr:hypothetical protein GLIP_0267 [Aliiglaciecola lipolytica E3]